VPAEDGLLYEFNLFDAEGSFLKRLPCVPPFEEAPEIAISGERYFLLMEDGSYHEASGVHWLPAIFAPTGPAKDSV